jgi:hypothetical protein
MDLSYQRGNPAEPSGHAILYFWGSEQPPRVYATYVVVLPISLDLVKYMPPFLASQIPHMDSSELSAFAIPPMPEEVGSQQGLESLAEARRDDLLFGGTVEPGQVQDLLALVNEVAQTYGRHYTSSNRIISAAQGPPSHGAAPGASVNEVLYELMGPQDRLSELARLVGRLRFAVEGNDRREAQEVGGEIEALAHHLPETYRVSTLVESARTPTRTGGELAQLYLDRCYKLASENYTLLGDIEERIRALESGDDAQGR